MQNVSLKLMFHHLLLLSRADEIQRRERKYISMFPIHCCNLWWPGDNESREFTVTWRRHQMETFSALLALCAGLPLQWRRALMFSLICAWIHGWVNNHEAGNLRHHRAHYDVTVMKSWYQLFCLSIPVSRTKMVAFVMNTDRSNDIRK